MVIFVLSLRIYWATKWNCKDKCQFGAKKTRFFCAIRWRNLSFRKDNNKPNEDSSFSYSGLFMGHQWWPFLIIIIVKRRCNRRPVSWKIFHLQIRDKNIEKILQFDNHTRHTWNFKWSKWANWILFDQRDASQKGYYGYF